MHIDSHDARFCDNHEAANRRGLKLHLRTIDVGGYTYRVVTLRPATSARFSTCLCHETWRILTERAGALVLARLLWGLAFQRAVGTLVLIEGSHLFPTPYEAEKADPILLIPAGITRFHAADLRRLKTRLRRLGPVEKTVRWQTFSLPSALRRELEEQNVVTDEWRLRRQERQARMLRVEGFVCVTAPPDVLRARALSIYRMSDFACREAFRCALVFDPRGGDHDGEVEVFPEFLNMVSAASVARRELLGPTRGKGPNVEREAIYNRAQIVRARRGIARKLAKEGPQ
ncbi:MAG: hypothetical protein NVSMB1_16400 [Polyangiales bacterium]